MPKFTISMKTVQTTEIVVEAATKDEARMVSDAVLKAGTLGACTIPMLASYSVKTEPGFTTITEHK